MEWVVLVVVLIGVFTFGPGLKDQRDSSSDRPEACVSEQSARAAADSNRAGTIYRDLTVPDSRRVVVIEPDSEEASCQDD